MHIKRIKDWIKSEKEKILIDDTDISIREVNEYMNKYNLSEMIDAVHMIKVDRKQNRLKIK